MENQKPAHTPGPWHTFRQGTKHFVSQAADEEFRFAHAVVFEFNYHPDSIGAARNEAESNARLIAAAPRILAALRTAENALRYAAQESAGRVRSEIVGGWLYHADQCRAVIADAVGGAE